MCKDPRPSRGGRGGRGFVEESCTQPARQRQVKSLALSSLLILLISFRWRSWLREGQMLTRFCAWPESKKSGALGTEQWEGAWPRGHVTESHATSRGTSSASCALVTCNREVQPEENFQERKAAALFAEFCWGWGSPSLSVDGMT